MSDEDSDQSLVIDVMGNDSDDESEIDVVTVDEEMDDAKASAIQDMTATANIDDEEPSPPYEEIVSPPSSTIILRDKVPAVTVKELLPLAKINTATRSYRAPKELIQSDDDYSEGEGSPDSDVNNPLDSDAAIDEEGEPEEYQDQPDEDDAASDAEDEPEDPADEDFEMDGENSGGKRGNADEVEDDDIGDDYRLEEDDYDLLEENLGVKVRRRRYKRLRRVVDSDGEEDDETQQEEDTPESRQRRAEAIMQSDVESNHESDGSEDNFIVDDVGEPISSRINAAPEYSDANVQEAREIFGADFDFGDISASDQSEDEREDSIDSEDDQSEVQSVSVAAPRRRPKRSKLVHVAEVYDPAILEEVGITAEAQVIRATDIPERYQLRRYPLTKTGPELNGEVIWIYRKAFANSAAPQGGIDGLPILNCPVSTIVDGDEWEQVDTPAAPSNPTTTPTPDTSASPAERRKRSLTKIREIIKLIRDEKLEIPYIYFYHKDLAQPEFNLYDLWKIYRLDEEYCRLYERKLRLLELFGNMRFYQEALGEEYLDRNDVRQITQEDLNLIQASKELSELHDIQSLFLLYYADDVPKMKEMQARNKKELQSADGGAADPLVDENQKSVRHTSSGGTYRTCLRNGIGKMLPLIGLTAEEFGENLESMFAVNEAHQTEMDMDEVFQIFVTERFREKQMVCEGAKYMMATNISRDMRVRRVVRDEFHRQATICVTPTRKGLAEIDENHPVFPMMFLKHKPAEEMDGIDFVELTQAEKDGLINMNIGDFIPDRCSKGISLIEEAKSYFRSESNEPIAEKWEEFRGMIVQTAFEKMLYPELRKELRHKLLQKGRQLINQRCSDRIYNYIKNAPFTIRYEDDNDDRWNTFGGIKVLGVAYEDDTPAVCVVLDRKGCPNQSVVISNLFTRNARRMTGDMNQSKDVDRVKLRNLIKAYKPHVVVIGGESRGALNLADEIREVLFSFPEWERNYRFVPVHIIENDISKVMSRTASSKAEFPGSVEYYRQAVSLGRFLQDPLLELAQLFTRNDDILSLHLYKYQRYISNEELMRGIELEFINRTCETGVDVNDAAAHPHRSYSLQFVAGFGFHKASGLLRKMRQDKRKVENRAELMHTYKIGTLVFKNAAGFLRIKEGLLEGYSIDPRDQSRIHPQFYEHARTVCRAALDDEEQALDYDDSELLLKVMTEPNCQENLKELNLDGYLEQLKSAGYGDLKFLFADIIRELLFPYTELRKPFFVPTQEELFYILTKETFESVREAKLLTAYINDAKWRKQNQDTLSDAIPVRDTLSGKYLCRFCAAEFSGVDDVWHHYDDGTCQGEIFAIHIRFGNGITGIIRIENLSDEPVDQRELLKLIELRAPIQVRVLRIDLNKFFLECTSKTSDLQNVDFMPNRDPYYDEEAERERRAKNTVSRKRVVVPRLCGFIRRNVAHPSFKNIPYQEADAILKDMDQGDCIFRPSTKGLDQLSLSWNVAPGITQHVNITEQMKPSHYELGAKLIIGDRDFEDLDEIMARFVNPQAAFAREIITYKHYNNENYDHPAAAAEYLSQQREKNPDKIHYCLTASRQIPGTFKLSFLVQENLFQEVLTLFPEGICFRTEKFQSIQECLDHWKKGCQKQVNRQEQEHLESLSAEAEAEAEN